jgi:hypothetical protein
MPANDDQSDLSDSILHYLTTHEHAADTAAGVARWWLGRSDRPTSIGAVEEVLSDLARRGLLEQQRLPDGTLIYRRTRGRT